MSQSPVRKYKFFFTWEDDREEQWLQQMARQGLHLVHANMLGFYRFRQGNPAEVSYRLDYVQKVDGSYRQLFEDAGWEHVISMSGWHYWRKQATAAPAAEIFTDAASKAAKYRRILGFALMCCIPLFVSLCNPRTYEIIAREQPSGAVFGAILASTAALAGYAVVRLLLRIRRLEAGRRTL